MAVGITNKRTKNKAKKKKKETKIIFINTIVKYVSRLKVRDPLSMLQILQENKSKYKITLNE